jgi:hypothetical protein
MARLEAFAHWATHVVGEAECFVVDDADNLLWGAQEQAGLVLSSLMAMAAALRSSALSACENGQVLHQTLPGGRVLTVIPCATRLGMIHLAVLSVEALVPERSETLRCSLIAAMDAGE